MKMPNKGTATVETSDNSNSRVPIDNTPTSRHACILLGKLELYKKSYSHSMNVQICLWYERGGCCFMSVCWTLLILIKVFVLESTLGPGQLDG